MARKKRDISSLFSLLGSSVLVLLIILNFLKIFDMLSVGTKFILDIISIVLFAYLFYKISISHLIFGNKSRPIDLFILIGFLLFSVKNVINLITTGFSKLSASSSLYDFFNFVVTNQTYIEYYGFAFGSVIILLASSYFCFVKVGKNSLMNLINESKKLHGKDIFIRFIVSFVVLLCFYIIVFNLAIEWLVLVMHGPVLLILFFIYLFIALHKHRFRPKKFLHNVAFSMERAYEKLIRMFHSKRILLGICGLLVLHLLTDFFVFIIPYITGYFSPGYLSLIYATPHTPIISLFLTDLISASSGQVVGLVFVYLFNLIAISVILLTPFYMWLKMFKNHKLHFPRWCIALSFASLFVYIAMPLFTVNKLKEYFYGVDIITKGVSNFSLLIPLLIIGLVILIGFYLLSGWKEIYNIQNIGLIFFILIFVFIYLYNFFVSISSYYLFAIYNFSDILVRIVLFVFFVINILFYILGYAVFIKYVLVDKLIKKK